jgi:hypothetical protein
VVEREASGDFDYLWEDSADVDGVTSDYDALAVQSLEEVDPSLKDPEDDLADDPGDNFWDNQPDPDADPGVNGQFDAFNVNTWSFTPPPPPWYRTKSALTAIVAAAAALVAITVSGVLLVFRGADGTVDNVTSSVAPTAPTSAEPLGTSAAPEPSLSAPPPPPPPPETAAPETAAPVNTAPNRNDPTVRPRPTKAPEIGVTRTPVTRAPISVAPQPRSPRGNG